MRALTKSELIDRVFASHGSLTNREAEDAVNEILKTIITAMSNGVRVEIRGFGSFSLKYRAARKGRNPRTGEILEIPAGKKLVFITCKELKEAMRS